MKKHYIVEDQITVVYIVGFFLFMMIISGACLTMASFHVVHPIFTLINIPGSDLKRVLGYQVDSEDEMATLDTLLRGTSMILMALGCWAILVAMFGFCIIGPQKNNNIRPCCTIPFAICLLPLWIITLGFGIAAYWW